MNILASQLSLKTGPIEEIPSLEERVDREDSLRRVRKPSQGTIVERFVRVQDCTVLHVELALLDEDQEIYRLIVRGAGDRLQYFDSSASALKEWNRFQ